LKRQEKMESEQTITLYRPEKLSAVCNIITGRNSIADCPKPGICGVKNLVFHEMYLECMTAFTDTVTVYDDYRVLEWMPISISESRESGVEIKCIKGKDIIYAIVLSKDPSMQDLMRNVLFTSKLLYTRKTLTHRESSDSMTAFHELVEIGMMNLYISRVRETHSKMNCDEYTGFALWNETHKVLDCWNVYAAGEDGEYCIICYRGKIRMNVVNKALI
jgi:hypothetical protein